MDLTINMLSNEIDKVPTTMVLSTHIECANKLRPARHRSRKCVSNISPLSLRPKKAVSAAHSLITFTSARAALVDSPDAASPPIDNVLQFAVSKQSFNLEAASFKTYVLTVQTFPYIAKHQLRQKFLVTRPRFCGYSCIGR